MLVENIQHTLRKPRGPAAPAPAYEVDLHSGSAVVTQWVLEKWTEAVDLDFQAIR